MPLASRSRADRILMFLPFFSMSPYVPFVSSVSSVTSPPKTVAKRASSYSVSVWGNVASRLMYAAVSLSAFCIPASCRNFSLRTSVTRSKACRGSISLPVAVLTG